MIAESRLFTVTYLKHTLITHYGVIASKIKHANQSAILIALESLLCSVSSIMAVELWEFSYSTGTSLSYYKTHEYIGNTFFWNKNEQPVNARVHNEQRRDKIKSREHRRRIKIKYSIENGLNSLWTTLSAITRASRYLHVLDGTP